MYVYKKKKNNIKYKFILLIECIFKKKPYSKSITYCYVFVKNEYLFHDLKHLISYPIYN